MHRLITCGFFSGIRSHHQSLLAVLFGLFSILPVLAGGQFNPSRSVIAIPAQIRVSNSAAVTSTIWTSERVTSDMSLTIVGADRTSWIWADVENGSRNLGNLSDTYATNLPGVGVRWRASWNGRNFSNALDIITVFQQSTLRAANLTAGDSYPQSIWIELVKTGNIANGNLSIGSNAWVRYSCDTACTHWRVNVVGQASVVNTPACSVANPRQTVPLGRVSVMRFTGVGNVTASTPFSILLNCTGGTPGSATRPHVTLTDAFNNANRSTTLSLSNAAGSATGIGIQILHNGTVLGYGPASDEPGNINQWEAGSVRQGQASFEIALAARYVQTQAAVRTGVANGRVIFTMNYQ